MVLADAIGVLYTNSQRKGLLYFLLCNCDAEHALERVEFVLAHPDSCRYKWNAFGFTAIRALTNIQGFPSEALCRLVNAGAKMFPAFKNGQVSLNALNSGLETCAEPSAFIDLALKQGAAGYIQSASWLFFALVHLLKNRKVRIEDCVRIIRACASPDELWLIQNFTIGAATANNAKQMFQKKFGHSLREALQAAEQGEDAASKATQSAEQESPGL